MKKLLQILILSIISIVFILSAVFTTIITYQKLKSEAVINHVISQKGWSKKIKHEEMHFNIKMGKAEKEVTYKNQPHSVYTYTVTPSPAPWTDAQDYKIWGETDLEKKESYYKYLLEAVPYR